MAKRRAKRIASKKRAGTVPEDLQYAKESKSSQDAEVDRWSATIRLSRDLEIDNLRTRLQLFRSYFSEEQIQTPVLQFFEENLPNFSIVKSVEQGNIEVHRKGNDCSSSMNQKYDDIYMNDSLVHRMSSFSGLELMSKAVKPKVLPVDNTTLMLGEPSDSQLLGLQDALQTPGVNIHRPSIGMTPNTVRLPKHGEMLLSVRGSPLGVYNKQDNMEAINVKLLIAESEEG